MKNKYAKRSRISEAWTREIIRYFAGREDAPVAQVARRAIVDFLSREEPSFGHRNLPLVAAPDGGEAAR